jgi:DNA modification methylase
LSVRILTGDCLTVLPQLAAGGVRAHCCVTDPPYELGFMGKRWDSTGIAFHRETWAAVMSCLRPGAHLLAFGGTRTQHRMVCAIEDAGFEIRDTIMFMYGSGFPKSHNVNKALSGVCCECADSEPPAERGVPVCERCGKPCIPSGLGTSLKPAFEPIIVARKPLSGTVAANVLRFGTGALNVDACRVPSETRPLIVSDRRLKHNTYGPGLGGSQAAGTTTEGRWPANVIHDGSPEVEEAFARFGEKSSGSRSGEYCNGTFSSGTVTRELSGDTGSASRFFFCAKADATDRAGSRHPTVKPTSLMRWLVQLVCPRGGLVLDPFAGSGSTGLAADQLGSNAILIERDPTYAADARRKITSDAPLFAEVGN